MASEDQALGHRAAEPAHAMSVEGELEIHHVSDAVRLRFPDQTALFDHLEEEITFWQKRFRKARGMAQFEEQRLHQTGHLTARRQIGHLAAATGIRLIDLASGLVVLTNSQHAHPAYAVARALVETAAVPAYAARELLPRLAKSRKQQTDEILRRLTMGVDPGLDLDWRRDVRPIRVAALVDAMCAQVADALGVDDDSAKSPGQTMRQLYSVLSDHAHPNFSAVHLSSTLDEGAMTWSRSASWIPGTVHDVIGASHLALWCGGLSMDALLSAANRHPLVLADKR